jgi:hypothetical protein
VGWFYLGHNHIQDRHDRPRAMDHAVCHRRWVFSGRSLLGNLVE